MGKRHPRQNSWRNRGQQQKGSLRNLYRRARLEILENRWVLSAPSLAAIPDASIFQGAPYPIALQGSDADGDPLTYTITSSNPNAVEVLTTATTNRSLKITMAGFGENGADGEMVLQLFEDRVPATTARIIQLAQQGFYDGLAFHRIIQDFMIQGGDPEGTGSGGSGYQFDDEFSTDLQFTRDGILAMANAGNDTNDSQFFITDASTRWLDYEHSIFGFLTSGDDVRKSIQDVTVDNGVPTTPPVMKSVTVINDNQRDVVLLKLKSVPTDPIDVTVTVSDTHGNSTHQNFTVTPYADTGTYGNSHPFLNTPIPTVEMAANSTHTLQLTASDAEGDPAKFTAEIKPSSPSITASADTNTGLVTIKASNNVAGVYGLYLQAYDNMAADVESEPLWIDPAAPGKVTLLNPSSSGATVSNRDNSANKQLQFQVEGLVKGTEVTIYADGQAIGSAVADGTSLQVTTDGTHTLSNGAHTITAVQVLKNQTPPPEAGNYHGNARDLASAASAGLAITVDLSDPSDTTPPTFTSTPVLGVGFGATYTYNADTDEDTRGVTYRVVSFKDPNDTTPDGMAIDAKTGVVTWKAPTQSQLQVETDYNLTIAAADLSANESQQTFKVHVGTAPVIDSYETNKEVAEGTQLSFAITASDDNAMPLTFSLVKPPAGATVVKNDSSSDATSNSGVFTWTPSESQGPGTYTITVRATDSTGVPSDATVTVKVTETNQAPTLATIAGQAVDEGSSLQVQLVGTDADVPANTLQYSFVGTVPDGMQLNAGTGLIQWTPGESFGGSTSTISVQASDGTDTSAVQSFQVAVRETDSPPQFTNTGALANLKVVQGTVFTAKVTAQDPDTPANTIRYELASGAPATMQIDSSSGTITWSAPADYPLGATSVTVRAVEVKADGSDGLAQTLPVSVQVLATSDSGGGSGGGGSGGGSGGGGSGGGSGGGGSGGGGSGGGSSTPGTISLLAFSFAPSPVADLLSPGRAASVDLLLTSGTNLGTGAVSRGVAEVAHVLGDNGMFGMQLAPDTGRAGRTAGETEESEEEEPRLEKGQNRLGQPKQESGDSQEKAPQHQNKQRRITRHQSSEAYDAAVEALVAEAERAANVA